MDDHRKQVIRLATDFDTIISPRKREAAAGLPISADLLCSTMESLAGVGYLAMDYVIPFLECREYHLSQEGYVESRARRYV